VEADNEAQQKRQRRKKFVVARYLQLKSGHTITGAHLKRIGKVEDARCWWCSGSKQTVAYLLLEYRKWLRERKTMIRNLGAKDITIDETRDRRNLRILFEDNAMVDMLEFVEKTEVGKKPGAEPNKVGSWDVELLNQSADEGEEGAADNDVA
jgi:hypothetical protein